MSFIIQFETPTSFLLCEEFKANTNGGWGGGGLRDGWVWMNVALSLKVLLLTQFFRKGSLFRIPMISGDFQMLLTRPCLLELLDLSWIWSCDLNNVEQAFYHCATQPSNQRVLGAHVHSGGLVLLRGFDVGATIDEIPFSNPRNTPKSIEIHISHEENQHKIKLLTY